MLKRKFGTRRRTFRRRFRPFSGRVRPKYDRLSLFNTLQGDVTQGALEAGNPDGTIMACGPIVSPECSQSILDCTPCVTPPCATPVCCAKTTTIRLVSQALLQAFFQDRVTIVGLYGDVWCRSLINMPFGDQLCSNDPGFPTVSQYLARFAENWNVSLRKMNQTQSAVARPEPILPGIPDFSTPLYDYDWTEARWLFQRNRYWAPRETRWETRTAQGSKIGCCGNTSGGALNVVPPEASGSQPTYDIDTRVHTECEPCTADVEGGGCADLSRTISAPAPPWHHFRIRVRRHITLRSDETLDLQIGRRHPPVYPGSVIGTPGWGCDDTLNQASTMIMHVKIGAVVRLN